MTPSSPPPPAPRPPLQRDAVCAGCGLLCDDVAVEWRGDGGRALERDGSFPLDCELGRAWFASRAPLPPAAFLRGEPVSLEAAIDRACRLLQEADAPVVAGLHGLSLEALRAITSLAATLAAPLAPLPSLSRATARAGIDAPELSATQGDVRANADLIVLWGIAEGEAPPRLRARLDPPDRSRLPCERAWRTMTPAEATVDLARQVLARCAPGGTDRARAASVQPAPSEPAPSGGAPRALADALAAALLASRRAHIFLGDAAARSEPTRALLGLLAARRRPESSITVSSLPSPGNTRGLEATLLWLTGASGFVLEGARLIEATRPDVLLLAGCLSSGLAIAREVGRFARHRIVLGGALERDAEVSFVTPLLDPRRRETVLRWDGLALTLSGRAGPGVAVETPAENAAGKRAESPSASPVKETQKGTPEGRRGEHPHARREARAEAGPKPHFDPLVSIIRSISGSLTRDGRPPPPWSIL